MSEDCKTKGENINTYGNKQFDDINTKNVKNTECGIIENGIVDTNNTSGNDRMTCSNAHWGRILFDYSQQTSFHGPKQIFETQPFLLRRLIWLLLFMGGMVIFLLQVATSIEYYLSWPVSVDVKINYNDSILFPAVTICNGNAFRITKAYEYGYYKLLNEVYGADNYENLMSNKYNNSDLSLEEMYLKVGHSKEHLVVKCEWDESPCSADDFITSMTDYGLCYTFNGDKKNTSLKWTSQTGAEGGLRLQLNIEQYQYMHGPNEGAGLKILIHRQNEIPLVRDYGLAVPPGSHGLVAVKTIEINNLEPNHGKCNDSVRLEYFDKYSVSNCYTNCKERYLEQHCSCRDIYMPSKDGVPRVCTIKEYTSCVTDVSANFHKQKKLCECPIPCNRLLYEPVISYASTSNFDTAALLRTNWTSHLSKDYIYARETTQRINEAIIKEDIDLITMLNLTITTLDHAFVNMKQAVDNAQEFLQRSLSHIQKRIHFHKDRGIEGVKYIVKHDFNRGWEVFHERSFHYVTLDFMDLPRSVNRTILNTQAAFNLSTEMERYQIFSPVMDMLFGRQELIDRAADYIDETNHAYLTGTPLLTYKLTYNRRYDLSYISLPLLHKGRRDQAESYRAIVDSLNRMTLALTIFQEIGEQFVKDNSFNDTRFEYAKERYLSGCRKFNYRYFTFSSRVVEKPLEVIEQRIADFALITRAINERHNDVTRKIHQIESLIDSSIGPIWQDILNISEDASLYLSDITKFKTPLSQKVTSKVLEESIRTLSVGFSDVRSRVRELQDELTSLKLSYRSVWRSMLLEESTKPFYEMIYNDSQDFLKNETLYEMYLKIFRYMLRTSTYKLQHLTPEEIVERINGDFFAMNIDDVFRNVDETFANLSSTLDLAKHIGDADELFLVSFERFRQSMQIFLGDNVIDTRFYRENFMRLDVFMQELSYEEITQQKSYVITQLLSDIGGSMGLFIGGSVLSVFEFLDIFIHHGARIAFNR